MYLIAIFVCVLVQLEPSMMIIYGRGQSTTTIQYLNTKRPLWILEDQVRKHDEIQTYSTTPATLQLPSRTPIPIVAPPVPPALTFLVRTGSVTSTASTLLRPPQPLRISQLPLKPMPRRIRLPSHYMNTRKSMEQQGNSNGTTMHWRRRHIAQRTAPHARGHKSQASMPIFDNAPGQDNEQQSHPIFFYNGPRGELIVNTMLSTQRYPMHEPVPGQVLYPPLTPMFRPKPIVERIRLPNRSEFLNLTLIPFYEHEAIDAPTFSDANLWSKPMKPIMPTVATVATTTTPTPTVLYETQLKKSSYRQHQHERHRHQYKRQQKHKKAKAKHYTAYHSPDDVQWQPPVVEVLQFKRGDAYIPTNTASPYSTMSMMQTPPNNHRHFSPAATPTSSPTNSSASSQSVRFNNNVKPPYESADEPILNFSGPLNSAYDNNDDDIDSDATGYGNRHVEVDVNGIENGHGNHYIEFDVDAIHKGKDNRHLDVDIDGDIRFNAAVEFEQNFPIIYLGESNEELSQIKDTSTEESSITEDYEPTSLPLTTTPLNSSSTLSLPALTISMKTTTPNYGTLTSTEQAESRLSSRYALTKEYYAFPVYTLGKLLHSTTTTEKIPTTILRPTSAKSTAPNGNTWFILNSRYKGPYKNQSYPLSNKKEFQKYYTSKYIENSSSHGDLTKPKPKAPQNRTILSTN